MSRDDTAMLAEVVELAAALPGCRERFLEATGQGNAFLAAAAAWPCPLLETLAGQDVAYPVAVGAVAGAHGIGEERATLGFLHAFAATLVSAAVRLIPLGQQKGLRILAALEPVLVAVADGSRALGLDDIGSSAVRADLAAMHHETQYTRLFRIMTSSPHGPLRVGIGGPVGTGKTALMDALCKHLRDSYDIAAITNDIYTKEDAEFLTRAGSLTPDRILGIETGGCPHTAIREDASINLAGVADLNRRFPGLDVILIESGGDNLAATFSPELADITIYVIDVSAGDKIPRKGGPGITRSDLLVINKIDLAPYVGASLDVMDRDARKMRGERPFVFTNIRAGQGVADIAAFIERHGGLSRTP